MPVLLNLFFYVLVAIASLDLKVANVSCKTEECHLTFRRRRQVGTHARWKGKQLLLVAPETTTRRVIERDVLHLW